ncbi:MAG: hypothetical protein ACI4QT_10500 [Kiritimatiellia bacterium]
MSAPRAVGNKFPERQAGLIEGGKRKMNENEKVEAALGGGQNSDDGRTAEIAKELEKSRHTNEVLAGRLKAQGEEVKQLREEVRKLNAGKTAGEVVDKLTPEQLGDTPKAYAQTAAAVSAQIVDEAQAAQKNEVEKLRAEIAERDKRSFYGQIGRDNAKFFDDIAPGGDKATIWAQFKAENKETYDAIMATHDVDRFNTLVGSFYRRIGVKNPSGGSGTVAAPDPGNRGGGNPTLGQDDADGQKKYTADEYLKEVEKAEEARDSGDMATYRALTARLNKALNEGRVG